MNGDEVFRRQAINIGFFQSDGHFEEYEHIMIEDKELTEVPQLVGKQIPEAFLMNSNDHGFGVFIEDDKSIRYFEQNLNRIESQLNKAVVIGQLLIMIRQIQYPATRLPLILS